MKIILISAPPRAGKDTIAKYFYKKHIEYVNETDPGSLMPPIFERFSQPLKASFAAITGAAMNKYFEVEGYEQTKDEVIPWLGVSYRRYQIDYSEKFMKPQYSDDIFGKLMLQRLLRHDPNGVVLVPDCGFRPEVDVIYNYAKSDGTVFKPHDILLCRVYRDGCTFEGDSRSYVAHQELEEYEFDNNSTQDELEWQGFKVISNFIRKIPV